MTVMPFVEQWIGECCVSKKRAALLKSHFIYLSTIVWRDKKEKVE